MAQGHTATASRARARQLHSPTVFAEWALGLNSRELQVARQARPRRLLEQVSQGWSFPASCCPSLFPSSPPLQDFPSSPPLHDFPSPPLQDCSTVPPHPRLRMLTEEGRGGHVSLTHVCDFKAVTFPVLDLLFHCGFKGLKVRGRDIFRAREGCPTPSPPLASEPGTKAAPRYSRADAREPGDLGSSPAFASWARGFPLRNPVPSSV